MSQQKNTQNTWFADQYAAAQTKALADKKAEKVQLLTRKLYEKFKVDFTKLTSVEELTGLSTDDECEHYIDLNTRDVYSWNFVENKWEEVNEHNDIFN